MGKLPLIIALFTLGSIIGIYLLMIILHRRKTSKVVTFLHGLMVTPALFLLNLYRADHPGVQECIILFLIAVAGGLVLAVRDLFHKSLPKWLAISHGLIALVGFLYLIVYALT